MNGRVLLDTNIVIAFFAQEPVVSSANQHNLTLVTRDAHFNEFDKLSITSW